MRLSIPESLQKRLGHEASLDLLELLDAAKAAWSEHVLNVAVERFERRMAEEMSRLRVEMHQSFATQLKWSFLFWVGQVAAMAGLLAFVLRAWGR